MAQYDAPEGIVFYSNANGIDYTDTTGPSHPNGPRNPDEVLGLSKSQIETMDLICEGPILGLVSGEWVKTGVLGEIGWRSAIFTGYNVPASFNSRFLRSVYWNEVPVLNDSAQFNFQSINVKYTEGKPNGDVIQVLSPYQTVSRTIGERLRGGVNNIKTYRIFNKDCRGVVVNVKIPSLYESVIDEPNNDLYTVRRRIDYSIAYKPIYVNKFTENYILAKNEIVFGKITLGAYIRTTRIDFSTNFLNDQAFAGWEIKIERSTPDSDNTSLQNQTYIDSLTEIQGNVYTFPNSAMVRSLFDAEYFQSVPERAFDVELLKVKIPGNYNPILKNYNITGFATTNSGWNGQFATGLFWTDNPAWCYYDILTNPRYGLGKYIDSDLVDTTSLYEIGKYCDTLVSDGYGGLEPRFSCNLWITSREEAYKVVNDMASVFRGLTYYAHGQIYVTQDSPKSEELLFNNSNVEDGNFEYSTTSKRTRGSVAIVRYNDPKNFYRPAVEYVEDFESIRKYGIKEIELSAFGCTSRGQAIRLGRWALLTDKLESETVTFNVGIGEASRLSPGAIFKVHDTNRKYKRYGGRVVSISDINSTGSQVVLDYKIDTEPNIEYKISFLTPSFIYNTSQVSGLNSEDYSNINRSFLQKFYFSGFRSTVSGNRMVVNLNSGFDFNNFYCSGNPTWIIELSERYETYTGARYFATSEDSYYRTINITENEPHKYQVVGLQYNPQKYIEIESGLSLQKDMTNQIKIPATPYNLQLNVYNIAENLKTIAYSFLVDSQDNINSFKVYAKKDTFADNNVPASNYLINNLPSYLNYGEFNPTETGTYYFRVYSSNDAQGVLSTNFASNNATIYSFEPIRDVIISALEAVNITGIYTGNAANNTVTILTDNDANPSFTWQVGSQNSFVNTGQLKYRASVRPFSEDFSRIPSPSILYQESGITTTSWDFTLGKNLLSSGGPYREYSIVIEAHDNNGKTSAGNQIGATDGAWNNYPNGYDILSIKNPRQTGVELKTIVPTQETGSGPFVNGNSGKYNNVAYIGPNGDVTIQFTSGQFDADLVGGYIYCSTGQFPKDEAAIHTGYGGLVITKNRFNFNPVSAQVYHPTAAINLVNKISGFVSLSFYDEIDETLIGLGVNVTTGLYVSNNAVLFNDTAVGKIVLAGPLGLGVTIQNLTFQGTDFPLGPGGTPLIDFATATIISSGTANNTTSVLFMYPGSGGYTRW